MFGGWCSGNKLIVNESKTQYILFYKRRVVPDFVVQMNGMEISRTNQAKFLGLHVDSQLTWAAHIEHVAGKLKSAYFAIVNLKTVLTTKQLLNVYYALAYSHLKYMVLCWGQATELGRIFILLKRIIRKIYSLSPIMETCKEKIFKSEKIDRHPYPNFLMLHRK